MQRLAPALALAAMLATACGGSPSTGSAGSPPSQTSSSTATSDPGSGPAPVANAEPVTEAECLQFFEHFISLMVDEHNQKLRDDHTRRQAKLADDAAARGEPPPKKTPFDERTLWTREDLKKGSGRFTDKHLKRCLKMPRAAIECGIKAKSAAALRQC
jgi:hypothetical protein